MAIDLADFLEAQTGGEWNCSTLPADWAMTRGHPDFAAAWRETLLPVECDTVAAEAGGLIRLWERDIGDGLPVVEEAKEGDIAVIEALGIQVGAVYTGTRWAIRGARIMHYLAPEDVRVLKVWRV